MFTICMLSFGYGFCAKGEQRGSSKVCPFLPSRTVTSPMLLVPFGVPGCWLLIYSYPLAEWGLLEAGENCCSLSESESHSLCPTPCDPMDYTVHRILQARILEWVTYPFSGDLPDPGIKPGSPALQVDFLPTELSGKPFSLQGYLFYYYNSSTNMFGSGKNACLTHQMQAEIANDFLECGSWNKYL